MKRKKLNEAQMRILVKEFFWRQEEGEEEQASSGEPVLSLNTTSGDIDAIYSPSGLAIKFMIDGKDTGLSFSSQGDVKKFRDMLDELLQGPLRSMP